MCNYHPTSLVLQEELLQLAILYSQSLLSLLMHTKLVGW